MAHNERLHGNPERGERNTELENVGHEQRERLREDLEREQSREKGPEREDEARHEALERAKSAERSGESDRAREAAPAERRGGKPSKRDLDKNFDAAMTEARTQMSAPSRAFSKVIHNKGVERVSEVAGSTIARPNAVLSGAVFAFLVTLAVYLVAKHFGYPLSGFESIGAFVVGWVIGLLYDFVRTMITGRSA